ncbi:MAG: restriction endonuclease [Candidatus Sericytochromatia bacterium]
MKSKFLDLDWKSYEKLISGLFLGADLIQVEQDVHLIDKDGSDRQVDCLVTVTFGPHSFRVVVECKSGATPIERGDVDKLLMTKEKVNASQALLFANGSFQSGAINTANANGVSLFNVKKGISQNWVPAQTFKAFCQVFCIQLQNELKLPWSKIEIGRHEGVSIPKNGLTPSVSFFPERTATKVVGRSKLLEDLIEDSVFNQIGDKYCSKFGVIGEEKDCIGFITLKCNVSFEEPIILEIIKDPLILLKIPEISINAAIRIEKKSVMWKSADDLNNALIVHDVCKDIIYQVGQDSPDSIWTWIKSSNLPLSTNLSKDHVFTIVSRENFYPECFEKPWSSFDKLKIYDCDFIAESKTMQDVLKIMRASESSRTTSLPRRRSYLE